MGEIRRHQDRKDSVTLGGVDGTFLLVHIFFDFISHTIEEIERLRDPGGKHVYAILLGKASMPDRGRNGLPQLHDLKVDLRNLPLRIDDLTESAPVETFPCKSFQKFD